MADEKDTPTLAEQQAAERDYYLRKTDVTPDGTSVAEAKKAFQKSKEKQEQAEAERFEKQRSRAAGNPAPTTEEPAPAAVTTLPDEAALRKIAKRGKNDLVEQAASEGLNVEPTATIDEIIVALLKHREASESTALG